MIRETDTRDKLKNALTILLNEKSLNDISVSELTKEASINRGTFYLHYDDKMDLVDNLVEEIFRGIKGDFDVGKGRQQIFLRYHQKSYRLCKG